MEEISIYEFLRKIGKNQRYYINVDTWELFDLKAFDREYLKTHPEELYAKNNGKLLPDGVDLNIYELPTYDEINHKEIMRFYVKELVYEKDIRKELFDILKRFDYMDMFYEALEKYNLYEHYCEVTDGIYHDVLIEWANKNNIDLKK